MTTPLPPRQLLLKPTDAAKLLELHVVTLARWRMRGEGPPWIRAGRCVRYPLDDLEQFLEARRQPGQSPVPRGHRRAS